MAFQDQLKKARLAMGYTQQNVADIMEITNSTYCGYETGKRQPDVAKIKQLAKILHTTGDFLLETGFDNNINNLEKENKNHLKDEGIEIFTTQGISLAKKQVLESIDTFDDNQVNAVSSFIKYLTDQNK